MIQPEWLNALLGFFMPILVQWIKNKRWSRQAKTIVALTTSILIGIVSVLVTGQFSYENILQSIAVVFSVGQLAYNLFWKSIFEGK